MEGDICKIVAFLIFIYVSVKLQKVEAVTAIGAGVPVPGTTNRYENDVNRCKLVYEKYAENKPDIFVSVVMDPGLCRITSQANESDTNYQWQIYNYAGIPHVNVSRYISREIVPRAPGDDSPASTIVFPVFDEPIAADDEPEPAFLKKLSVSGLNYDAAEQWIFFLLRKSLEPKERELYRVNINGTERKVLFNNKVSIDTENKDEITKFPREEYKMEALIDIAYDWVTKNVYFSSEHEIYAINALNAWDPVKIVSNRSSIISLVIHPNKGYLYFIDHNPPICTFNNITREYTTYLINDYTIYRVNLDGSNLVQISETSDDDIVSLAIDFYTDRLYWNRPNARIIQQSNLDGSDVKNITGHPVYYGLHSAGTHSIGFDSNYVYYIKPGKTIAVHRYSKIDNKEDENYKLTTHSKEQVMFELLIFDSDAQKVREDHPCLENNGGCQKFCFAVHKEVDMLTRVCKCSMGEDLAEDGVSCRKSVL